MFLSQKRILRDEHSRQQHAIWTGWKQQLPHQQLIASKKQVKLLLGCVAHHCNLQDGLHIKCHEKGRNVLLDFWCCSPLMDPGQAALLNRAKLKLACPRAYQLRFNHSKLVRQSVLWNVKGLHCCMNDCRGMEHKARCRFQDAGMAMFCKAQVACSPSLFRVLFDLVRSDNDDNSNQQNLNQCIEFKRKKQNERNLPQWKIKGHETYTWDK